MPFLLIWLLVFTSMGQSGNADVVAQAKADLVAAHADISGPCGAFRITNLVVWRLRPAYGFLQKAGGFRAVIQPDGSCISGDSTSAPGYATDYIIDRATGYGFDLLGDGGGANNPQWSGPETDFVARNRSNFGEPFLLTPVDPSPVPTPTPTPTPTPQPTPDPRLDVMESNIAALQTQIANLTRELGAAEVVITALSARVQAQENRVIPTSCHAYVGGLFSIGCKLQ